MLNHIKRNDSKKNRNESNGRKYIIWFGAGICILLLIGGFYYWYDTKDIVKCDDYLSHMNSSVDEFEKEFGEYLELEKVGQTPLANGNKGNLNYRKYSMGIPIWQYIAITTFPNHKRLMIETPNKDTYLHIKGLFGECDFTFFETTIEGTDIYKKGSVNLLIFKKTEVHFGKEVEIYVFLLK